MLSVLPQRALTVTADTEMLGDTAIADELVAVRAEIDRLEARFAELAWAAHRRGVGTADGSPSTAAWLRRHTGMREGDARSASEAGEVATSVLPAVGAAGPHRGDLGTRAPAARA